MNRQILLAFLLLPVCTSVSNAQQILSADLASTSDEQRQADRSTVHAGLEAGERQEFIPGMAFRWCPPTAVPFRMGRPEATDDESPVSVSLSSGFWLGETEVTQQQWTTLMKSSPWREKNYVRERYDSAASCIRHGSTSDGSILPNSATEFCLRLTEQERRSGHLPADWKYSLPTEAQWEYACRAGTNTLFHYGDDPDLLIDYAWYKQKSYSTEDYYAHPVGLKKQNAWGFYDMHGNVWEWCLDWYQEKLPGGRDPVVLTGGSYRVRRGGSWGDYAAGCGSATRVRFSQSAGVGTNGFRVAAVRVSN